MFLVMSDQIFLISSTTIRFDELLSSVTLYNHCMLHCEWNIEYDVYVLRGGGGRGWGRKMRGCGLRKCFITIYVIWNLTLCSTYRLFHLKLQRQHKYWDFFLSCTINERSSELYLGHGSAGFTRIWSWLALTDTCPAPTYYTHLNQLPQWRKMSAPSSSFGEAILMKLWNHIWILRNCPENPTYVIKINYMSWKYARIKSVMSNLQSMVFIMELACIAGNAGYLNNK